MKLIPLYISQLRAQKGIKRCDECLILSFETAVHKGVTKRAWKKALRVPLPPTHNQWLPKLSGNI